ncbi:MAG: hypothetical protein ABI222_08540 [Opitutaceae bacterium]
MKKILPALVAGLVFALVAGCSTTDSRVSGHQALFNTWPADVQQRVRAGQVAVGFTPDMVQVALGNADRTYSRTTEKGTSEVWVYEDHSPRFSVGLGVGGVSGSSAVGAGVRVGDDGWRNNEKLRVIFEGGRVVAIESRGK